MSSASIPLLAQQDHKDSEEESLRDEEQEERDLELDLELAEKRASRKRKFPIPNWAWLRLAGIFALGFASCAIIFLGWRALHPFVPPEPVVRVEEVEVLVEVPAKAREFDMTKMAVLVEKRNLPVLVPVLLNFLSKVPEEWPFQVWCGRDNMEELRSARLLQPFVASGRLNLTQLPDEDAIHDGQTLSKFLTAPFFWESLAPAKTIFFFQPDSLICSHSHSSLDDFLGYDVFDGGYDWVGAPWDIRGYPAEPWGGNGGFSIRRRETMLNITTQFEWDGHTPEDVWFAEKINETTKRFPTQEVGMHFSFESLPSGASNIPWAYQTYGMHVGTGWAICKAFHDWTHIRTLMEWCPDAKLVMPNECIPQD